ncbi:hypothetical protein M0802_014206 [Mischocyttarus mexicanus]|nr:hypothetical protein M0802_014206 [Mischocyttarus mexicanus]
MSRRTKDKKRSHISEAIKLADAKAYSDSGSKRRRTKDKTALHFNLSLAVSFADVKAYSDSVSIRRRTKVKNALYFDLSHRLDPINREAILLAKKRYNMPKRNPIRQKANPKAKKRCSAIGLADAMAYYDLGSIGRRTKVKNALDFNLSHKKQSNSIGQEAITR